MSDLEAFLRDKLAEAERSARVRDDMAACDERRMTPQEWKAAMALHPSTVGKPMPSRKQQREAAALQRRIAAKQRRQHPRSALCRCLALR